MRYLCLLFLLIFGIHAHAQNQEGMIEGIVYDALTNQRLSEVEIIIQNKIEFVTKTDGSFEILSPSGTIEPIFILIGYETQSMKINLKEKETIHLEIFLIPAENELSEVVISADKIEKRISDLSVSADIIKQEELTNRHIGNAEDIIKQSQGIEINDGQMSIRGGSGFSYGAGSRVLALTNGLPVLSSDAGNIRWQFLPLENLAQIEIIKGASSVLYGSSALNGIINFIEAEADTLGKFNYSFTSGIYDRPKNSSWQWWTSPRIYSNASVSYSKKIGKTSFSSSGNYLFENGYRTLNDETAARINFSFDREGGKEDEFNYGMKVLSAYNKKTDFILWEDAEFGGLKQNVETATELNALFFTIDPYIKYFRKNVHHELKVRTQISDNTYPQNAANNSNANSIFAEYMMNAKVSEKMRIITGITDMYSLIRSEFYGDHKGNNSAVFLQTELQVLKRIKAIAGVRLEYNILDGNSDELIPVFRTGMNYSAGKSTHLRASFGQGYRYPSIAEKYAYTNLGSVKIFPNTEIKSERGWSAESGIKQGLKTGKLIGRFDFAAFFSENKDMIEYVFGLYPDPYAGNFDFGFQSGNIENARIYGTELLLFFQRDFKQVITRLGGGYTFIHPIEISDRAVEDEITYLKYRRKHTAQLSFHMICNKIELNFITFYKSKVLRIDDVFLDPLTRENLLPGFYEYWTQNNTYFFLSDLFISYKHSDRFKFSLGIKNVGNTEYFDRPGNILPHRSFSFNLSGQF